MKTDTSRPLPDFGQSYFDHVMAEYDLLPSHETAAYADKTSLDGKINAILEKYRSDRTQLTWGDLYELEKYILDNQPPEVVESRASSLRESYREIVGQRAFEAYLQSHPRDGKGPAIRADAGRLLDGVHWGYSLIPEREQLRTKIIQQIASAIAACFVPAAAVIGILYYYHLPLFATLVAVVTMGALGGFVSLQQRIQKIPTEGDPILTMFELHSGQFSLYLAPLTGAIFALVMFLIFAGGLVSGSLFPRFEPNLINALGDYKVCSTLLVWSFIAGFAERFVPDTLDGLITRAQKAPVVAVSAPPPKRGGGNVQDHAAGTGDRKSNLPPRSKGRHAA